jgi:hypothetical protein
VDREIEIAAAASLGGWLKRKPKHIAAVGTPCANCGTALQGPYCHHCGQLAEDFHRSFGHLVEETVENLFHLDGRLWRTLPRLALKPADLTRDYLEGRRAGQIPPLRLFLVVVLLFFFAGGLVEKPAAVAFKPGGASTDNGVHVRFAPEAKDFQLNGPAKPLGDWLKPRVLYAAAHQHEFSLILEGWAHRFAILLLPATALMMGLLFVFQRRFFLYDHLVFSMHSLSFMGLLLSVKDILSAIGIPGALAGLLVLGMPAHLFVHLRGVYRIGVFGTLLRMALLFAMTCILLLVGVLLLVAVGLAATPANAPA